MKSTSFLKLLENTGPLSAILVIVFLVFIEEKLFWECLLKKKIDDKNLQKKKKIKKVKEVKNKNFEKMQVTSKVNIEMYETVGDKSIMTK